MIRDRYDVVIAGARVAGASTAMLLARRGLRVLVVDPQARGHDTLSTHALMRGAVLQLHRLGLLESLRAAGTPPLRTTTFHYGSERSVFELAPEDEIDALYAPRRTVLDPILVEAAVEAGAEVVHGVFVAELKRDADGRVNGASLADSDGSVKDVACDLVIGADGAHSKVARLVDAPVTYAASHGAATIYAYWSGLESDGSHWYFTPGLSAGVLPTNGDQACVFVQLPKARFDGERGDGLELVHGRALAGAFPDVAARTSAGELRSGFRAFPGTPGFLRTCVGAGWALVGDAACFKDPITAHGIMDALCEAEALATAVAVGSDEALRDYRARLDARMTLLMIVSDQVASMQWDLDQVRRLHRVLLQAGWGCAGNGASDA